MRRWMNASSMADPNRLWVGLARLERVDVLRCGIEPAPPKGWRKQAVTVTLSTTALGIAPRTPVDGWAGIDVPFEEITRIAVDLPGGQKRSPPTLGVLIHGSILALALRCRDRIALAEALSSSILGSRMGSWEELEDAPYLQDDDGADELVDPGLSAATEQRC